MKKILAILAVGAAVTLGGCHVFKQKSEVKNAVATEKQAVVNRAPSLESLDARITSLEKSRAAARAAFKAQQKDVKGF